MMSVFLCLIFTEIESKIAVHPKSQSWPMEMREPEARSGKMWALHAPEGKEGRIRSAVWVESRVLPSGKRTEIPGRAFCLLMYGRSLVMKCPVALVSATAGGNGEGGEEAG
jgi:hypothetical protein